MFAATSITGEQAAEMIQPTDNVLAGIPDRKPMLLAGALAGRLGNDGGASCFSPNPDSPMRSAAADAHRYSQHGKARINHSLRHRYQSFPPKYG
jgi:hypothetical protein